jgi:hypothetical protein
MKSPELGRYIVPTRFGTCSKENGSSPLFILNGDPSNAHEVDVVCEDFSPARSTALTGNLITAWNMHSGLH